MGLGQKTKARLLMVESIKAVLMERDGLSESEAKERVAEAQEAFNSYIDAGNIYDAYNIAEEYFGLEPDYMEELI